MPPASVTRQIHVRLLVSNERSELKKEVSRLSTAERLQAMEWLWVSLSKEQQDIESPEWHGEVLAARQAKVDSGEAQFLTVDQLKDRLRH